MNNKNIMVCVTKQKTSERLILKGQELIEYKNDNLYVIHVVNERARFLEHDDEGEALEYLFQVSKNVGANLTVLRSKNILRAMIDFAKNNQITHIVIGATPDDDAGPEQNFSLLLKRALPDVDFTTM